MFLKGGGSIESTLELSLSTSKLPRKGQSLCRECCLHSTAKGCEQVFFVNMQDMKEHKKTTIFKSRSIGTTYDFAAALMSRKAASPAARNKAQKQFRDHAQCYSLRPAHLPLALR